jgi:hypothetical protein
MAARKIAQTFPYCNYGCKKKTNPTQRPIILMTTPKNGYAIEFLLLLM